MKHGNGREREQEYRVARNFKIRWLLRPLGDVHLKFASNQGILVKRRCSNPSPNFTPEQKKAADDVKLKVLKAKNYLFQAIERSVLETILKLY